MADNNFCLIEPCGTNTSGDDRGGTHRKAHRQTLQQHYQRKCESQRSELLGSDKAYVNGFYEICTHNCNQTKHHEPSEPNQMSRLGPLG